MDIDWLCSSHMRTASVFMCNTHYHRRTSHGWGPASVAPFSGSEMTKSSGLQTGLNLSTMGACGTKIVVLISEVSLFQGEKDMYLYNMKLELGQVS